MADKKSYVEIDIDSIYEQNDDVDETKLSSYSLQDMKFDNINDAIEFAEKNFDGIDSFDIIIHGDMIETQTIKRNEYSGDFVYYGYGYCIEDDYGGDWHELEKCNTAEECLEDENLRKTVKSGKKVRVASWKQTLYENIGDIGTEYYVRQTQDGELVLLTADEIKTKYIIRDREAGNKIECFENRIDAEQALYEYEDEDRVNGTYTPDFYEIVEDEELDLTEQDNNRGR